MVETKNIIYYPRNGSIWFLCQLTMEVSYFKITFFIYVYYFQVVFISSSIKNVYDYPWVYMWYRYFTLLIGITGLSPGVYVEYYVHDPYD